MNSTIKLSKRLSAAAAFVRKGSFIADVGTDHAYLPIYLVTNGLASHALACDINEGPIASARANIAAAGCEGRIETLRTDGLAGTEAYAPDAVLIFGMGGELIARILSDAPYIKNDGITLVLQPMSRVAYLRRWLLENGFEIIGESLSLEGKYYQTIAARFAPGKALGVCSYSEEELLLGRHNIAENGTYFCGFLAHEIAVLERIVKGKEWSSFADADEERALLNVLKQRLEMLK